MSETKLRKIRPTALKTVIRAYKRWFFALLAITAIVAQLARQANILAFNVTNFFSFFTIESNILAAIVLLYAGYSDIWKIKSPSFDKWRGAATLYMTVTGLIYVTLLSGLEDSLQTPMPWVNAVLHYILPLYMLLDWLLFPPAKKIRFSSAARWLAFPVAYVFYSLFRGSVTDWFPYPFLNYHTLGFQRVILNSVAIGLAVTLLAWLLTLRHQAKAIA